MTIAQIYENSIKSLPAAERLRLAIMILNEIPPQSVVDYREDWSEEDLHEATLYSMIRAGESLGED